MKKSMLLLSVLAVLTTAMLVPLFIGISHQTGTDEIIGGGEDAASLSAQPSGSDVIGPEESAASESDGFVPGAQTQSGAPQSGTSRSSQPSAAAPKPETPPSSAPSSSASRPSASSSSSSSVSSQFSGSPSDTGSGSLSYAEQVATLVNEERVKAGLQPLAVSRTVTLAAQQRAKEIEGVFSHTRPDGSSFSTALAEQNVVYRSAGENIAWGQKTPEQVMQGWMNSSGHRANILNPNFTAIGVGYYRNAAGTNYWTQLFIG